jgi:hypothetical protein
MLQDYAGVIALAILGGVILCIFYGYNRRAQRQVAALREAHFNALDRQNNALERIASALEASKDRPTTN